MGEPDLPAKFHEWATREMHFRPQGRYINSRMPTKEDFSGICRGQLNDVWNFVINHVHSAQTVRKVQGNLKLKRASEAGSYKVRYRGERGGGGSETYSEDKAALLERRKALSGQLTAALTAAGHVEKDMDRLKKDIITAERGYGEATQAVRETRRRTALLHAHAARTERAVTRYTEYTARTAAAATAASAKKSSDKDVLYSKPEHRLADPSQPYETYALETACTRSVRENCEEVGSFLQQLLQGDFSNDKPLMQEKKESQWQGVESTMTEFPAHQILASLSQNAHDSANSLREKTSRIDIQRDAEKLRFKYESSGRLQDLSSSNDLQTVHQLLEEAHRHNIERCMETEKSRNHTWQLKQRLAAAGDIVDSYLTQRYRDDTAALNLARQVYSRELQTAADRAGLRTLQAVAEELQDRISKGLQYKQMLHAKYRKIQDFNKLADSKQQLIHVLVKQNMTARSRLDTHQAEIHRYMSRSLGSHEGNTKALVQSLNNTVLTEVDAFKALALQNLMFTDMEGPYKTATQDLSIYRLTGLSSTPASQALCRLMEALDFPMYKAPECLLPHIARLRREIHDIEAALAYQQARAGETEDSDHAATIQRITGLCESVWEKDEQQVERVLPMLQQRLAQTTRALTDCLAVKDTAQAWWEQPGQRTCPWMKADEMTLQNWRDKWTVDVTRLRQAQVQ